MRFLLPLVALLGLILGTARPSAAEGAYIFCGTLLTSHEMNQGIVELARDCTYYHENVVITNDLHLSSNGATIAASSSGSRIEFASGTASINDLYFEGSVIYANPTAGTVNLSIKDSIVHGLVASGPATVHLEDTRFQTDIGSGLKTLAGATTTLQRVELIEIGPHIGFTSAIENDGTMHIIDSIISRTSTNDGVGIFNRGDMHIHDSLVAYNSNDSISDGGGIWNSGTLNISDSIIAGNMSISGDGGGIYNTGGTVTITSSIIQDNSAGQGSGILNEVSPGISGTVDARHNWWGAADGPGEEGPGSGDGVVGLDAADYTPWLTSPPALPISALNINQMVFIDAVSDQPLPYYRWPRGSTVYGLDDLPAQMNIRATTSGQRPGSVAFYLNDVLFRVENVPPFALYGDINGDYMGWAPEPGIYTVRAVPYSGPSMTGDMGMPLELNFTVVAFFSAELPVVDSLTIINVDTGQPIPRYGMVPRDRPPSVVPIFDLSETPHINLRADIGGGPATYV
ncbi:MAG: hypothetical protein ACOCXZ_02355, partial [Chloroflexota bacterium]